MRLQNPAEAFFAAIRSSWVCADRYLGVRGHGHHQSARETSSRTWQAVYTVHTEWLSSYLCVYLYLSLYMCLDTINQMVKHPVETGRQCTMDWVGVGLTVKDCAYTVVCLCLCIFACICICVLICVCISMCLAGQSVWCANRGRLCTQGWGQEAGQSIVGQDAGDASPCTHSCPGIFAIGPTLGSIFDASLPDTNLNIWAVSKEFFCVIIPFSKEKFYLLLLDHLLIETIYFLKSTSL